MEENVEILNVIERWESLGLLEGIPVIEKADLAQIYDNATKLLLSNLTLRKIPKKVSDLMDEIFIPVCRRIYKRVGPSFMLDNMMSELLEEVNNNIDVLTEETNGVENPIIQFCVNFADNYTDTLTTQNTLSKEEYTDKIKFLISKLETILLNDNMVSYVNKEDGDYNLKLSDNKKSYEQTRFWNQGVAKQLLESFLSNLNKGL
jgi:histone H3/H4